MAPPISDVVSGWLIQNVRTSRNLHTRRSFNPSITAKSLWHAVTVLRLCESRLRIEQEQGNGKERLIVIHGNRFVLHVVFHVLRTEWAKGFADDVELAATVNNTVSESLAATIQNVVQHYSGAYPASLFKNTSKCRDLKNLVTEWVGT